MNNSKKIQRILVVVTVLFSTITFGWAQCPTPTMVFKPETKAGWFANSQSKSGAIMAGEKYEFTFIAQRGMEYRFTAAGGPGMESIAPGNVEFIVSDSQVQKVNKDGQEVFKRTNTIVFDSKSSGSDAQCIISTPKTRKLTVTVNLVASSGNPKDVQCALVFIESRRAQEIGLK